MASLSEWLSLCAGMVFVFIPYSINYGNIKFNCDDKRWSQPCTLSFLQHIVTNVYTDTMQTFTCIWSHIVATSLSDVSNIRRVRVKFGTEWVNIEIK